MRLGYAEQIDDRGDLMRLVTVQFACPVEDYPAEEALRGDLVAALQDAYDHPAHPGGSFVIVSVGGEEPYRDLDPCFAEQVPAQ